MTQKTKTGIEEIGNLLTVGNYAKFKGLTRRQVFMRINDGTLKSIKIDGIIFIENEKYKVNQEEKS